MMEIQRLQRDIFIVQDLLSNENKPDSLQYKRLRYVDCSLRCRVGEGIGIRVTPLHVPEK